MGMKFYCAECGHVYIDSPDLQTPFIAKDHVPCPKCGASAIKGEVLVEERISMYDSYSMKARDDDGVFLKMRGGGSRSADGTIAQVEQVVDKRGQRYRKKVTLADGTVVKDVEGSLQDQSLHGKQQK